MIRKVQDRATQIVTGFKSPADDYLEGRLNIADKLVVDPQSTFYFQMDSNDMQMFQIPKGALLIVDRSLKPENQSIVIVSIEGELVCRCYKLLNGKATVGNKNDQLDIAQSDQCLVWGVVTAVCTNMLPESLKKGRYRDVCAM